MKNKNHEETVWTPKSLKQTPIEIEIEGEVIVNHAHILYKTKCVALILLDTKTKWCKVDGHLSGENDTVPSISISKTKKSTSFDPKHKRSTIIAFKGFEGWEIFATNNGRYTTKICLTTKS